MSEVPRTVVVVGGGPAGAAAAIRLARLGHDVLVLDREHFPRSKPCGECLNPAAVRELEELGVLPGLLELPHALLRGWRIAAPSGRFFTGRFPPQTRGLAMPRSLLDAALLEEARRAGAEVRTGVRVGDLLREGDVVCGVRAVGEGWSGEIRTRLVIGADGLRSVVMRRLGLGRRPPRLRKVALTAHARGGSSLDARGELHVTRDGCIGIAAVGDGRFNVTVVSDADGSGAALAGRAPGFFDAALAAHPRLCAWRREDEVLATGPFDWPVRRAVAPGALLVGDAAGYFDPFTGQGIYRALRGAALAVEPVHEWLSGEIDQKTALARYERARRRAFAPGERLQRVIEAVVSRERLIELAAARLAATPALADRLVGVAGDLHPVRSLLDLRLLRSVS